MDLVDKIHEQIAHHRSEILRLEAALSVIAELGGKPVKAKETPMITIRKVVPNKKEERPKLRRNQYKYAPAQVEAAILEDLRLHGPSKSAAIGKRVTEYTEGLDKRLWGSLYALNKQEKVRRDENHLYHLVAENVSQAA